MRTPRSATSLVGEAGLPSRTGCLSSLMRNQNVLPSPGALLTPSSPPMASTSRLEMASPRPVPPKRRAIVASACP